MAKQLKSKNTVTENLRKKYGVCEHDQVPYIELEKVLKKQLKDNKVLIIPRVLEHTKEGNLTTVRMNADIINVENPIDKITLGDYFGYGVDNSDKGIGKAISYGYKYMLMKLFMTKIGEAEDSEFSNPPTQQPKQQPTNQSKGGL